MKILYLGYWNARDGLSVATIYPYLEILADFENIKKIHFINVERSANIEPVIFSNQKITHYPQLAHKTSFNILNKILDFIFIQKRINAFVKKNNYDKIIARGVFAGTMAYKIYKKTGISFTVESFEPHAQYMLESKTWRKFSLRYYFQLKWENLQIKHAHQLLPVSYNYKNELLKQGVSEQKIEVLPCCVDTKLFEFSLQQRNQIRNNFNIPQNAITGVYVGKFGGLYYENEAYQLIKKAFKYFANFYFILLTPDNENLVMEKIKKYEIPLEKIIVKNVLHTEVPKYLSASDFAFAFYKSSTVSAYLSPIKIGEYWANGLPIIIDKNIGDDSLIIEKENVGIVSSINTEDFSNIFAKLEQLTKNESKRKNIMQLAYKYRSMDIALNIYKKHYA